jgi:hypothetical protein
MIEEAIDWNVIMTAINIVGFLKVLTPPPTQAYFIVLMHALMDRSHHNNLDHFWSNK